MSRVHNRPGPMVDQGIRSLAACVLLLAALFLWNRLHAGSCLALGLPTLVCLAACYGIFTYRLERKRFALRYWLDPGSSLRARLGRHWLTAAISLVLGVSLTGALAIFAALARGADWYFLCAIAVGFPLAFTALRVWPGGHFRQTAGACRTALADVLTARLAGWLVFAGVAAGYVYLHGYYLPLPVEPLPVEPGALERSLREFAGQAGSACPVVADTLGIAAVFEGLSWHVVAEGTSLPVMHRDLGWLGEPSWLVRAGFFLNRSVAFVGFIRSLEGALLLARPTAGPHGRAQRSAGTA